ncbi:MAG: glutaminyl-peptide cyclotransferase [Acidobacteriota bacterium]
MRVLLALLLGGLWALSACAAPPASSTPSAEASSASPSPSPVEQSPRPSAAESAEGNQGDEESRPAQKLKVEILQTFPHDRGAYTQGLLWHQGKLFESTGLYGASSVRRVDLQSGRVEQRRDLDQAFFGEGLERIGDRLVQLTWLSGLALYWDVETFEPIEFVGYRGEGWGLCFDGQRLIRSDGTATLYFHDPESFELLGSVEVREDGRAVHFLNELECIDDGIWANVYKTRDFVRIDGATGGVTHRAGAAVVFDAARAENIDLSGADYMNGIAYRPAEKGDDVGTFLITGKLWPRLYEVAFVDDDGQRVK